MTYRRMMPYLLVGGLALGCTSKKPAGDILLSLVPTLNGWQLIEAPQLFTHDNLYDHINGQCELYFSHGFRGMVSARFQKEADPEHVVTVDIYDMGSALGAFGVYSNQSSPEYTFTTIGCEAIVSPQQVRFWQEQYQVEINGSLADATAAALLSNIAQEVSRKLPACQPLPQLNWLPEESRVPHTLKYVAQGFLGQDFLPGGLEAMFHTGAGTARAFLSQSTSPAEAAVLLHRLQEAQRAFAGTQIQTRAGHFESHHPYTGHMWAGTLGAWLYGAASPASAKDSRQVSAIIGRHLQQPQLSPEAP